jgi:chemotaxis protein CheD
MNATEKVFVQGGQWVVTNSPTELITVLGSCVAVCLWDKKTKTGGMNHFLLPTQSQTAEHGNGGTTATRLLIKGMLQKVFSVKNLEARIFGGGNRFFKNSFLDVSTQNVEVAKKILTEAGIPIVSYHTGGDLGRKISFNTETGSVLVQIIPTDIA